MNGESVGDALFLGWLNLMMKMKEFDDEGEEVYDEYMKILFFVF